MDLQKLAEVLGYLHSRGADFFLKVTPPLFRSSFFVFFERLRIG